MQELFTFCEKYVLRTLVLYLSLYGMLSNTMETTHPTLIPQKWVDRYYEMVKNRLRAYELKWLDEGEITEKMDDIAIAYKLAKKAHRRQIRASGENYFKNHVLGVLQIYLDELRGESIEGALTCLFHDCPEDTEHVDLYVIEKLISEQVSKNVYYLTKPKYEEYLSASERNIYESLDEKGKKDFIASLKAKIKPLLVADYFKRMEVWANNTTLKVKTADRLHNLRSLPNDAKWIVEQVEETENFLLPLLISRGMRLASGMRLEIELLCRELIKLKLRLSEMSSQAALQKNLSNL